MTRADKVVDADGHILEPLNLWDDYIGPAFRERRPRFVIDDNGKEGLTVEGKLLGNHTPEVRLTDRGKDERLQLHQGLVGIGCLSPIAYEEQMLMIAEMT